MENDTILKKETVKGYVDRGGVFHEAEGYTSFIAEKYTLKIDWVSEYFNVRLDCKRKDDETETIPK
jgi:hypothetical protein